MKIFIALVIFEAVMGQRFTDSNSEGAIVFPGESSRRRKNEVPQSEFSQSLALARKIDELDTIEEYARLMNIPFDTTKYSGLSSRSGSPLVTLAKPAKCKPELQTVSFKEAITNPSITFFPTCTRIKRCSNCCTSELDFCEATRNDTQDFSVMVSELTGVGARVTNIQVLTLIEHKECSCNCRQKAEHCNIKQRYIKESCSCECKNGDERNKCTTIKNALWDSKTCSCRCKFEHCSSGYYFDDQICECRDIATEWSSDRKGVDNFRKTSNTGDILSELIPPSSTDPRRKHKDEPH